MEASTLVNFLSSSLASGMGSLVRMLARMLVFLPASSSTHGGASFLEH